MDKGVADNYARNQIDDLKTELPRLMQTAVSSAIREVISDKDITAKFWETGYTQLQDHAVRNGSQWVGKRIVTSLVIALVTAGLIWLVKTGALK